MDSIYDIPEPPLIDQCCPNCLAVDVVWGEHSEWLNDDKLAHNICPYCTYTFNPNWEDYGGIWSDDFADLVTNHFPKKDYDIYDYEWKVISTSDDWHKVEIGFKYNGEEFYTFIEMLVDPEDGQVLYEQVEHDCKQIIEGVKLANDPTYLVTFTEPKYVLQGYRLIREIY